MDELSIISILNDKLLELNIPPEIIMCISSGLMSGRLNCKDDDGSSNCGSCKSSTPYVDIFNKLTKEYPDYKWMRCIGIGIDKEMELWNYSYCDISGVFMYSPAVPSLTDLILRCLGECDTYDRFKHPVIWAICETWYTYVWSPANIKS